MHEKKSYKRMTNVGIFVLSIVLCLFLIEVTLRLFRPVYFMQPVEAHEYDSELGYRIRAGMHLFSLTDYQQEFRTNHLGTLNFQEDFSNYEIVIFAIGDSYTQGLGVPHDSSYPFLLDLILNIDDKGIYFHRFGVVNLGLGPYGGKQELIVLKRFAKLKKPNIVLYLGCSNDYSDDVLFEAGTRHKNIVLNSPYWGCFYYPMKWFFLDTELGKRIKYFVQEGILKARVSKIENQESQGRTIAEMEQEQVEQIVATSREVGAIPILSWFMVGDSYSWLKSWATKNDILFADWEPAARSVSIAIPGIPWENQHSGSHHRSWLNFVIARAYAEQIKAIGNSLGDHRTGN
ncbi:MAG: hypothetical protein ACLQT6_16000 [Desulfomonilaceae bacterium]